MTDVRVSYVIFFYGVTFPDEMRTRLRTVPPEITSFPLKYWSPEVKLSRFFESTSNNTREFQNMTIRPPIILLYYIIYLV